MISSFLVPGMIGVITYHMLVEACWPSAFLFIIYSFLLTLISAALTYGLFGIEMVTGVIHGEYIRISENPSISLRGLVITIGFSILFIVLWSSLRRQDRLHRFLRSLKLTEKTGHLDVWHDVFSGYQKTWVEVRFSNGDVLVGWPERYSTIDKERELFLVEAYWVYVPEEPDGDARQVAVDGPGVYINNWDNVIAMNVLKGN